MIHNVFEKGILITRSTIVRWRKLVISLQSNKAVNIVCLKRTFNRIINMRINCLVAGPFVAAPLIWEKDYEVVQISWLSITYLRRIKD